MPTTLNWTLPPNLRTMRMTEKTNGAIGGLKITSGLSLEEKVDILIQAMVELTGLVQDGLETQEGILDKLSDYSLPGSGYSIEKYDS